MEGHLTLFEGHQFDCINSSGIILCECCRCHCRCCSQMGCIISRHTSHLQMLLEILHTSRVIRRRWMKWNVGDASWVLLISIFLHGHTCEPRLMRWWCVKWGLSAPFSCKSKDSIFIFTMIAFITTRPLWCHYYRHRQHCRRSYFINGAWNSVPVPLMSSRLPQINLLLSCKTYTSDAI